MLNYLYAVLESEARLAAAALGLDPGIGVMHVDSPARDSLACDLMEPVRPKLMPMCWIGLAASQCGGNGFSSSEMAIAA